MIKSVKTNNFTVLPNAVMNFVPGVNVIIAENGMGKTHLLKLLYTLEQSIDDPNGLSKMERGLNLSEKLIENFRPDALGHLVRHRLGRGKAEAEVTHENGSGIRCSFSNAAKKVSLTQLTVDPACGQPIFLPAREMATLCPWFVGLYDNYHVQFEGTWRSTCSLLSAPVKKGERTADMSRLLVPLEKALGGTVESDPVTGQLLLRTAEGTLEMALVAEGLRKIVTLIRLICTGALQSGATLFWDEPEANLNPKYIRIIAECIMELAHQGVQVFVASHSVFLIRELNLLQQAMKEAPMVRWTALSGADKPPEQETDLWQLETFTAFDVEADQTIRFLNAEDNGCR